VTVTFHLQLLCRPLKFAGGETGAQLRYSLSVSTGYRAAKVKFCHFNTNRNLVVNFIINFCRVSIVFLLLPGIQRNDLSKASRELLRTFESSKRFVNLPGEIFLPDAVESAATIIRFLLNCFALIAERRHHSVRSGCDRSSGNDQHGKKWNSMSNILLQLHLHHYVCVEYLIPTMTGIAIHLL
jgi:hypothetical protein